MLEPDNAITALITQKKNFNQLAIAQMPSGEVYAQARQWYLEAVDAGIIAMLIRLVRLAPSGTDRGQIYQAQYAGKMLTIRFHNPVIEAKLGDMILLTNENPGEERINPGDWLAFCASEIMRLETELAAKKETEQRRTAAIQAQRKIAQDDQAQEWFSVDV